MTDENDNKQTDNLFDSLGLEVKFGEVEIGQSYPIYGMITEIVSDVIGDVRVVVNYNIEMTLSIDDDEKMSLLKKKSFEPGIFVCTITHTQPSIKGDCSTIIFGKNKEMEIH